MILDGGLIGSVGWIQAHRRFHTDPDLRQYRDDSTGTATTTVEPPHAGGTHTQHIMPQAPHATHFGMKEGKMMRLEKEEEI